MNYVNCIRHAIYTPSDYYRRYDLDLPEIPEPVKRVALASLPFVGLYRPAGLALSIGMNGMRTFKHLQNALQAEEKKDWENCAAEVGQAALATLSLVTSVTYFAPALFLTTLWDGLQSIISAVEALNKEDDSKDYAKAFEDILQTLASAAYLGFMVSGGLEAMLLFALLQAAISLYQARSEFAQGRYLEGCAKLAMTGVRLHQANQYITQIQKRNAYREIERIQKIFLRMVKGRQATHLLSHPLTSLKEKIDLKEVVLSDINDNEFHFGSHFHGNGGSLVKGENLIFRTKVIDGKEIIELDFKVNHAFRNNLQKAISELKAIKPKEMREMLSLSGSHAEEISFQSGSFFPSDTNNNPYFQIGNAQEIKVKGLGSILIGSSVEEPNLYDRVVVRLDANHTFFHLHELLAFVNLERALPLSTKDDIDRLKLGHLFRTFFPKEATPFERTEIFFSLPLEELKQKMFEKAPEMKHIFDTYFHKMKEEHLFDGRVRYRIEGLADAAREQGARALTAAVLGSYTDEELYERTASIIRMGMLSTEVRHENGFDQHGLGGSGFDYLSGGADSVYTQMFTEKNCKEQMDINRLSYYSKIRFLISLDALELGTYQYHTDNFGDRTYDTHSWFWFPSAYKTRENILEFIQKEQTGPFHSGHEIMLKERLAPSFFTGIIVQNEKTKSELIDYFSRTGLIQNGQILNSPVDRFIRVGTKVTEELIG